MNLGGGDVGLSLSRIVLGSGQNCGVKERKREIPCERVMGRER